MTTNVCASEGAFVHDQRNGKVYLRLHGSLRHIPNPTAFRMLFQDVTLGKTDTLLVNSDEELRVNGGVGPSMQGAYLVNFQGLIHLVQVGSEGRTYRHHITSPKAMAQYHFNWDQVTTIDHGMYTGMEHGATICSPPPAVCASKGAFVHDQRSGKVYLRLHGSLRHIPNPTAFCMLFQNVTLRVGKTDTLHVKSNEELRVNGGVGPSLLGAYLVNFEGDIHLVEVDSEGKRYRHHITTPKAMGQYHFNWHQVTTIDRPTYTGMEHGATICSPPPAVSASEGAFVHDQRNGKVYLRLHGSLRHIPNPTAFRMLFQNVTLGKTDTLHVKSDEELRVNGGVGPSLLGAYLVNFKGHIHLVQVNSEGKTYRHRITTPKATIAQYHFNWDHVITIDRVTYTGMEHGATICST
eukprot:gene21148-28036_t